MGGCERVKMVGMGVVKHSPVAGTARARRTGAGHSQGWPSAVGERIPSREQETRPHARLLVAFLCGASGHDPAHDGYSKVEALVGGLAMIVAAQLDLPGCS